MANYKIDKCKNYKQFDTRWSKLSYRVLPACVRLNGCGATALADVIYALNNKITPKETRKWLLDHKYVSANQGTYWDGIPACLKAYGFEYVKRHATMPALFEELEKKNRVGIILFRKGSRGGKTYTTSAHFCAITGYKTVGKKHYLHIMDPGPRLNDGWICYEDCMYGLVIEVWSGALPGVKTAKKTETKTETKKETKTETETKTKTTIKTYRGYDISYVQNGLTKTDFTKSKKDGWDYVIIRLGTVLKGKLYTDAEFESKYKNAKGAGLNVGVYFYSMAKTVADAKKEANYVVKQLADRKLTYPVFIDFEDPSQKNLGKKLSKNICEAFCKIVEDAGYDAGVYASYDWLTNRIDPIDKKYYVWLAQYPRATYKGRYEMHQYSSSGKVTGIGSKVDVNVTTIAPKEKPVKKTNAQLLAETATKLSYPDERDDAKYEGGKPLDAYKKALNAAYPDRSKWGVAPRAGASCDVAVGTFIRSSGIDPKCPRGLKDQYEYFKNSDKWNEVKNPTVDTVKDGDVIIYKKLDDTGHVCVHVGGKLKHASNSKWYPRTNDKLKSALNPNGKKFVKVYRAK